MELQPVQRLRLAMLLSLVVHLAGLMALPPLIPRRPYPPTILQVTLPSRIEQVRKALAAGSEQTRLRPVPILREAKPRPRQASPPHAIQFHAAAPVAEAAPNNDTAPRPPLISAAVGERPSVAPVVPTPAPSGHAVAPAAPDPPALVQENPLAEYGENLSRLIAQYREYPRLAQERGWEGKVMLRLSIDPRARLLDVVVSRSSGHEILDNRAVEMVKQVASFPRPPEGLHGQAFTVVVPVVFQLDQ